MHLIFLSFESCLPVTVYLPVDNSGVRVVEERMVSHMRLNTLHGHRVDVVTLESV